MSKHEPTGEPLDPEELKGTVILRLRKIAEHGSCVVSGRADGSVGISGNVSGVFAHDMPFPNEQIIAVTIKLAAGSCSAKEVTPVIVEAISGEEYAYSGIFK